jgi:hypothetical protein
MTQPQWSLFENPLADRFVGIDAYMAMRKAEIDAMR